MADIDVKDIEELKKILEVVGEKVPPLISGLLNSVLNKQNAEEYAKQVSAFYKELKESGMSEENAMELTRSFMESRDPMTLIKKIIKDYNINEEFSFGKKHRNHEKSEEDEDGEE